MTTAALERAGHVTDVLTLPDHTGPEATTCLLHPRDRPALDATPEEAALCGRSVDRFLIGEVIGRGGTAVVHRALDRRLGREVALKVLHAGGPDGFRRLARFMGEGRIAAALDHPGIVRLLGAGRVDDRPYLAYELVDGATLAAALPRAAWPWGRVALVRGAASALGYAHRRGVVHRDVTPMNVLVDRHGRVRVADFGLAVGGPGAWIAPDEAPMGTLCWAAPEQMDPELGPLGPWTDVWALGVILYQALTGTLPYAARTAERLLEQVREPPRPPRELRPDVPRSLEAACLRALRFRPGGRWANGTDLAEALAAPRRA